MNLFRKLLLVALLALCLPAAAQAACGSLPYVFTNSVSIVDASSTNANNNFLLGCVTAVDSSQIGPLGLFASQIVPNSIGTATFGGNYGYRFSLASPSQPVLSIFGATAQTGDLFDIFNVGGTTNFFSVSATGKVNTTGTYAQNGTTVLNAPASSANVAVGANVLESNTAGVYNTAMGFRAITLNTTGTYNIAVGPSALQNNTTGSQNVAVGPNALAGNTSGFNNVAIGYNAETAAVGDSTETVIGATATGHGSNTVTLGPGTGYPVYGGTYNTYSDRRLKRDIRPTRYGLPAILALQPRDFRWRTGSRRDVGFIAQEVRPVIPEIVSGSDAREWSVNYSGIIPLLVRAVQEQQIEIAGLRSELRALRQ